MKCAIVAIRHSKTYVYITSCRFGLVLNHTFAIQSISISLVFIAAYIRLIYSNTLTSTVTVAPEHKLLTNLKELLEAGCQILWPANKDGFMRIFSKEFTQAGIPLKYVDNWLFQVNGSMLRKTFFERKLKLFQESKIKLVASIILKSMTTSYALELKSIVKKVGLENKMESIQLKQEFTQILAHWKIGTPNRYWMMKTIQRTYDSGLFFKWKEWADWSYALNKT
ncbi:unnamed protein product [Orchesella dallaii]|uniref:Uncharacterized protein n=1 Tax=Orchesella dallaii TaxID=48710 RepID=A0ABP1RHN5_9HEXA